MNHKMRALALAPGSEGGVGPELLLAALHYEHLRSHEYFWCGDKASLELACIRSRTKLEFSGPHHAKLPHGATIHISYDLPKSAGEHERQALFLKNSIELAKSGQVHAIVTGPIEKTALAFLADGPWPGQTEYFAHHLPGPAGHPFMAFLGGPFIMSLLTTHVPLSQVAGLINSSRLTLHLKKLAEQCAKILRKSPSEVSIAVLGLNPHAGENGLLGQEEINHLLPAIKEALNTGLNVSGPWPADGYFAYFNRQSPPHDAVVATYHDQGLIAYKLLCEGAAVNATLGLSVPRTSPAHGTAFDLVGTGRASHKSTLRAIEVALSLAYLA